MHSLEEYAYELPEELIAQHPLSQRADARLMVVDRQLQSIDHAHVRDLPEILKPHDCLVLNDTRVVPARLLGYRTSTQGRWQGLFLESDATGTWKVLCKTRGKLVPGETIMLLDRLARDDTPLRLVSRLDGGRWIARPETRETTPALLERIGRVPLPHYIRGGEMVDEDWEQYQTIFASKPGAVAAPTAGLHFTEELFSQLAQAGIGHVNVTLHVGPGTFRPISSEHVEEHQMDAETGSISTIVAKHLNAVREKGGRIVAVGSTPTRVLETAAAEDGRLHEFNGPTDLYIHPPYQFKAVDVLLTNFHLPRTTLLVLVRTFGGDALLKRAYEEAVAQRYRFFSYGDAMLIL